MATYKVIITFKQDEGGNFAQITYVCDKVEVDTYNEQTILHLIDEVDGYEKPIIAIDIDLLHWFSVQPKEIEQ